MSEVPPEVTEAAKRLQERPVTVAAPMPEVFREIIKNDARRSELLNKRGGMTRDEWRELGQLTADKRDNLRPGAEQALSWNIYKGKF